MQKHWRWAAIVRIILINNKTLYENEFFQLPLIVMALFAWHPATAAHRKPIPIRHPLLPQKSSEACIYRTEDSMANNPKQTLKKAADIGYQYIEAAGYEDGKFYGMKPEEFQKLSERDRFNPRQYASRLCDVGQCRPNDRRCKGRWL
ncbi:MAG: hypothetical protein R2788_03055 [Saprospiraceae bacterium]